MVEGTEEKEDYLFRLNIIKNSFKQSDIAFEIEFELEPIKVIYEVAVIAKVAKFFKGKDTDDFRQFSADKLASLKGQTTASIQDLFQKRSNKLKCLIRNPVFELPFPSFNSSLYKRPEDKAIQDNLSHERKWVVDVNSVEVSTVPNDQSNYLTEYECLKIQVDQVKLLYEYKEIAFLALGPATVALNLGLKNDTKSAILKGSDDDKHTPEVFVTAELPDVEVHVTPDVYSGLVNIVDIIKIVNAEEQMKDLINDKISLWEKAICRTYIKTKSSRQAVGSAWQYRYMVLAGSYIYIYEKSKDLMPIQHLYACDYAIVENEPGLDNSNSIVTIKSSKQEEIFFNFGTDFASKKKFTEGLLDLQIYLRGGSAMTFVPELVHADPIDLKFSLALKSNKIRLCVHKENSLETMKKLEAGTEYRDKCAWLELSANKGTLDLKVYEFEVKLTICIPEAVLESGWLMPHFHDQREEVDYLEKFGLAPEAAKMYSEKPMVLLKAQEGNRAPLLSIDILANDLYSPTLEDVEILTEVEVAPCELTFAPYLFNDLVKALRNTKTSAEKDTEAF